MDRRYQRSDRGRVESGQMKGERMRKDNKYSLATSDLMSPGCIFIFLSTERKVEAVEQPRKAEFVC